MASWQNLIVRIVLPPTLALENKATLEQETTFEVVGSITPWYCSIDQVRLEGGSYLRNLSDLTIAAMIYKAGRDCDAISYFQPHLSMAGSGSLYNDLAHQQVNRFNMARQRYTQCVAARDLILNMWDVNMNRGAKTLGNFSVSKSAQTKDEEVPKKLTQLEQDIKEWDPVIRTAGHLGRGNRPTPTMAAKGVYGDSDGPTGRTWMVTGMGANHKSIAGYGSTGKPVKFGSPSIVQFRFGRYMGGYLSVVPKFMCS